MSVTVQEAEPCAEQAALMKSLGFELMAHEYGDCRWVQRVPGAALFEAFMPPEEKPELQTLMPKLLTGAFAAGQKAKAEAIRKELGLKA